MNLIDIFKHQGHGTFYLIRDIGTDECNFLEHYFYSFNTYDEREKSQ